MYKDIENEIRDYIKKNGKADLDKEILDVCRGKPDYVKRNLLLKYVWDVKNPADFVNSIMFRIADPIMYSHTFALLIKGLEKLDDEKVDFLSEFVSIDSKMVKFYLKKGLELNADDIVSFIYDSDTDIYDKELSYFYNIIEDEYEFSEKQSGKINISRLKEIQKMFRKNSHLLNFDEIIGSVPTKYILKTDIDYKDIEDYYYDTIWNEAITPQDKKEIICQRYFNEKLKNVENLLDKIDFSNGKKNIKNYALINLVLESEDLDEIYKALDEGYRKIYREMYYSYNEYCCKDVAGSLEKYETKSNIKKIDENVYDLDNNEFTLLIHKTNAFIDRGANIDIDFDKFPVIDGRLIISCSLISDMYLGRVTDEITEDGGVYFGFNSIDARDIVDMGTQDIFSSEIIGNNVPMSNNGNNYYDAENLLLNTYWQYNEVCIFRENQYTGERVKPDYIVCFDEVDENSKKTAKKFNIPIYFINTDKVYKNAQHKLRAMVEDEKNYNDAITNIKLFKRILSFAYGATVRDDFSNGEELIYDFITGTSEPGVLDKNLLRDFIEKTNRCGNFDKNHINYIKRNALKLNRGLNKEERYDLDDIEIIY